MEVSDIDAQPLPPPSGPTPIAIFSFCRRLNSFKYTYYHETYVPLLPACIPTKAPFTFPPRARCVSLAKRVISICINQTPRIGHIEADHTNGKRPDQCPSCSPTSTRSFIYRGLITLIETSRCVQFHRAPQLPARLCNTTGCRGGSLLYIPCHPLLSFRYGIEFVEDIYKIFSATESPEEMRDGCGFGRLVGGSGGLTWT